MINRPVFTLAEATQAAAARVNGVWDNAHLESFGPLSTSTAADVREIMNCCPEFSGGRVANPAAAMAAHDAAGEAYWLTGLVTARGEIHNHLDVLSHSPEWLHVRGSGAPFWINMQHVEQFEIVTG